MLITIADLNFLIKSELYHFLEEFLENEWN